MNKDFDWEDIFPLNFTCKMFLEECELREKL